VSSLFESTFKEKVSFKQFDFTALIKHIQNKKEEKKAENAEKKDWSKEQKNAAKKEKEDRDAYYGFAIVD
jgi:predicted metal-dependent phosphotriesterase family hydrolase